MKLNRNIYKIGRLTGCVMLASTLFASCSEDLEINGGTRPNGEGEVSLTIMIPDVEGAAEFGATRADEFQNIAAISEADEGRITTLWLLAYPDATNSNGAITKITQLTGHNSLNITTDGGYKQYRVDNFHTGNYHIYILANFDSYLPAGKRLSSTIEETDVRNLLLNFSPTNKLEKGKLPMYCLDKEIKSSENGGKSDNGVFSISSSTQIYADLNFLCAKVRHTILFDRTENGFSNQFLSNNVDFSSAVQTNLANQSSWFEGTVTDKGFWVNSWDAASIKNSRVEYPESGSRYFNIGVPYPDEDAPSNLNKVTNWANETQKAWQIITYVPETLREYKLVKDKLTELKLTSNGEDMETEYSFSPREYTRGKMYDFVAKLKKTDFEIDFNITDWDLQHIAYNLHGPYVLEIEETRTALSCGVYSPMGYYSDTKVSFDFPVINYTNENGETVELPFYVYEFIDDSAIDEDGNPYVLNPDFPTHYRLKINPEIPFAVLYDLSHENETGGYTNAQGENYKLKDIDSYHIVAGNLHKKIETELDLKPYLHVTPKQINIDTRQYYIQGEETDLENFVIKFNTNYDNIMNGVDFYLSDQSGLLKGLGDNDFKVDVSGCPGIDMENVYQNYYPLRSTEGEFRLNLYNLIGDHVFWKEEREFELTFTINVRNPHNMTGPSVETLKETVKIIIMPFSTNYVIHFYDNTHTWSVPHIFVYQDLLLPSDLLAEEGNPESGISEYAGKIVGYIEQNGGLQWNAATQYVFSNNVSFRGWKGYGGPDINNPYDTKPNSYNCSAYTQGFVMLGERKSDGTWNDDYGYTQRTNYDTRHKRYRYDVNFNEDHELRIENANNWRCDECKKKFNAGSKYSGLNDNYDYPGIVMENEGNGWWRYTLTGVAQPGITMIIFANTEQPWNFQPENAYRYPGAYDTGLPLFDFEDNEGWFIFNGQNTSASSPTNHFFYDDKPSI